MPGGEKNTFGLPEGEDIRREMVAIFREQRLALLDWMDTQGYKAFGLPSSWPSWESFKLGAADIAARVKGPIADIWGSSGKLDVTAPPTSTQIEMQSERLGANVNEGTTSLLNRLLSGVRDLFTRGKLSLADAIKRLRGGITEELKPMEAWRARMIAITEAFRAYHAAMVAEAYRVGVVIGWRWKTAEGACPLCLMIEAEAPIVQLDRPFALIGTGEYSVIEYPPAHPSCRCSLEPVVPSDGPQEWSDTLIDPVPPKPEPALPTYGDTTAAVSIDPNRVEETNAAIAKILGVEATGLEVANLTGAPNGSAVEITVSDIGRISVTATDPKTGLFSWREIYRDGDGKLVIQNISFELSMKYQGRGIGREMFGRQIESARQAGVDRIRTEAAGDVNSSMVGYKVWPKFGYDGPLPNNLDPLPESLAGARKVSDLLATPEGTKWWDEHGKTFAATFNLTPGSYSIQTWEDYLKATARR